VAAAIEGLNSGDVPVLEVLANEVDQLVRDVLTAFGPTPAIASEGPDGIPRRYVWTRRRAPAY
jgi:hypothetical protein